jgi:single-strand DNA-binding protein
MPKRRSATQQTSRCSRSLATKTSWKNDAGTWESRTEWHRCVAFGKLADFAGTLPKGAHVAVEGELRSHEYQREVAVGDQRTAIPQRVREIRVDSVLKLDRAAKRESNADSNRCPAEGHLLTRSDKVYTQMFQPHYVTSSEQELIEFHAPGYLANAVRIIAETGLRVYKELTPMRKDQVDLVNAKVWIPDSKTENGIAEVPLTDEVIKAFKDQIELAGPWAVSLSEQHGPERPSENVQDDMARNIAARRHSVFSDLRSAFDLRHEAVCWRGRRRVGSPSCFGRVTPRCSRSTHNGVADETGSPAEA